MTIHAFTELHGNPRPAYVNPSTRVSDPRDIILTVRSDGGRSTSTIVLTREQLRALATDALAYLIKTESL